MSKKYSEENVDKALSLIKAGIFNELNLSKLSNKEVYVHGVFRYLVGLLNAITKSNLNGVDDLVIKINFNQRGLNKGFQIVVDIHTNGDSVNLNLNNLDYLNFSIENKSRFKVFQTSLDTQFDLLSLRKAQDFLNKNVMDFEDVLINDTAHYANLLEASIIKPANSNYVHRRHGLLIADFYRKLEENFDSLLLSFDLTEDIRINSISTHSSKALKI